jgi:hypothetical protein
MMFYLRSHFGAEARYADQTIGIYAAIAVEIAAAAAQRHPCASAMVFQPVST